MNRRKTIILFLCHFMVLLPCKSQIEKSTQYGFIIGMNLSDFYTKDAISNLNAGFSTGGFIRLVLTNNIAIEPELYLSTKGTSVVYNSLLVVNNANLNLTYLEMPVIGVFNVTHLINFQIGSYISYLLAAQVKNVSNINLFNFEQNLNIDNYYRLDAGMVIGVGLDVKSITMGIRYNLGLVSVGKNQQFLGLNYNLSNARNGVLNFYLAIGLNQKIRK
ncbi:MAG: porin family protein [Paludibacter sp.]